MKFFVTAFLTFAFVAISANQEFARPKCNLTEATSPNISGLRLGMTTQQLLAMFPNAGKRREVKDALMTAKTVGAGETTYLTFDPATDGSKDQFPGVDSVSAGLRKDRVVDLNVSYVGTSWGRIDDWVAKLSETFKLPGAQDWVTGPSENPNKVLKCDGVEIEAAIQGGGASMRIRNTQAVKP
jgi:hypothetical protein